MWNKKKTGKSNRSLFQTKIKTTEESRWWIVRWIVSHISFISSTLLRNLFFRSFAKLFQNHWCHFSISSFSSFDCFLKNVVVGFWFLFASINYLGSFSSRVWMFRFSISLIAVNSRDFYFTFVFISVNVIFIKPHSVPPGNSI